MPLNTFVRNQQINAEWKLKVPRWKRFLCLFHIHCEMLSVSVSDQVYHLFQWKNISLQQRTSTCIDLHLPQRKGWKSNLFKNTVECRFFPFSPWRPESTMWRVMFLHQMFAVEKPLGVEHFEYAQKNQLEFLKVEIYLILSSIYSRLTSYSF